MRDISLIRRVEPLFFVSVAALYVIRRLLEEISHINGMVMAAESNKVPSSTIWRDLEGYNHTLNNNIPLIAGVCLFLTAWYVFHNLAYPLINDRTDDQNAWLYGGLTILLLLTSVFVYHFFKMHIRYRHDSTGSIIGLHAYSLYRKRTVLADAIGLGIFLCVYEILFSYYVFLSNKIPRESDAHFRVVSYLLLSGIALLFISFALTGYLPYTIWQARLRDILLMMGLGIQIYFLQGYVFTYILPIIQNPRSPLLISSIITFLMTSVVATTLLWGACTNFHFLSAGLILPFVFIVWIAAISIAYLRLFLTKEKTVLQTQVSTKTAELSSLRAQINPHFLFNALNSLYATALKENSEKTADGIQKLGDMMRFMLQENNRDRIPLDKEIEYLHNYIHIQRMRIDESHTIEIRVNIQEPTRPIYLAPMLLTPFVENAFKHGISLRNPSWIYITLTLDATKLYFKVHNTRHVKQADAPAHHDPEEGQSGVGLDNVRKRLKLIYPGRHTLDIQQSEQDYFVALTLVYW